jgi:hypothetical protein
MTATRATRLLTLVLLTACGSDEDPGAATPDGGAGADSASSTTTEDGGASTNADADADAAKPKPDAGTLFGRCIDGGCDPGLLCITHGETSFDGGSGKGCQVQVCTQGCDAGCPAPSPGCGAFNRCDPPSCL